MPLAILRGACGRNGAPRCPSDIGPSVNARMFQRKPRALDAAARLPYLGGRVPRSDLEGNAPVICRLWSSNDGTLPSNSRATASRGMLGSDPPQRRRRQRQNLSPCWSEPFPSPCCPVGPPAGDIGDEIGVSRIIEKAHLTVGADFHDHQNSVAHCPREHSGWPLTVGPHPPARR